MTPIGGIKLQVLIIFFVFGIVQIESNNINRNILKCDSTEEHQFDIDYIAKDFGVVLE